MSPTKATEETTSDEPEASDDELEADAEELSAQDELDLERLEIALATLDDESLRRGLAGVTEKQRQDLALQLNLPAPRCISATVSRPSCAASCAASRSTGSTPSPPRSTQRVNDSTVEALGDNSDDPSRADLDAVLPAIVDEYGSELVRLMLASYAISDAPVREVMRELLETDDRFALPEKAEDGPPEAADLPSFGLVARVPTKAADDPERAELLERRKVAKAERRAAAQRERAAAPRPRPAAAKRSTPPSARPPPDNPQTAQTDASRDPHTVWVSDASGLRTGLWAGGGADRMERVRFRRVRTREVGRCSIA